MDQRARPDVAGPRADDRREHRHFEQAGDVAALAVLRPRSPRHDVRAKPSRRFLCAQGCRVTAHHNDNGERTLSVSGEAPEGTIFYHDVVPGRQVAQGVQVKGPH